MPYANKEQRSKYKNSYNSEHYARLALIMSPDDAAMIRTAAKNCNQNYSQYVLQAVRERMAREEKKK